MLQYTVLGRVLPERVGMGLNTPLRAKVGWPNKIFEVEVNFAHSHITARVFSEGDTLSNGEILSAVRQVANSVAMFVSFKLCAAYQIVFDNIVRHSSGETVLVAVTEPVFINQADSFLFAPAADFEAVSPNLSSISDPRIVIALEELNMALLRPVLTAMHSYICLEYIKSFYCEGEKEKVRWDAMRKNLNVSYEAIMEMEVLAKDMKHGSIGFTTWDQRKRCLQIAWEVVHRQLMRLDGNNDIFPVIT